LRTEGARRIFPSFDFSRRGLKGRGKVRNCGRRARDPEKAIHLFVLTETGKRVKGPSEVELCGDSNLKKKWEGKSSKIHRNSHERNGLDH